MSDIRYISISFKRRRVMIHKSTLRALELPQNIRFLLNKGEKKVAVQCCEAIDRDNFDVPLLSANETFEITSISFVQVLYALGDWDFDKSYRISGTFYSSNRLVEFDLADAAAISDEEFVDEEVVGTIQP